MPLQHLGGFVGIDAVRPAAIRHHLAIARHLRQAPLQLRNGYGMRAGDVSLAVLHQRAHVEQRHAARVDKPPKLSNVDGG